MNGILVIDKPSGYTSRELTSIVGRFLGTKKIGHAGTLDPIATGVLVVAVGNGLKVLEYLTNETKEYVATVKLGVATDTLDITGKVIEKNDNYYLDVSKLHDVIDSFKGKYVQEVPIYSAVRVNGKKLYYYARNNEEVILPKREVEILDIELLEHSHEEFSFRVVVSKGTYIRSLIRDIGKKINICCTMKNLVRTKQGSFSLEDSINLDDIENNNIKFISTSVALSNYFSVVVNDELEKKILHGAILDDIYGKDKVVFKNNKDEVLAIYCPYSKDKSKIKPLKVLKKSLDD